MDHWTQEWKSWWSRLALATLGAVSLTGGLWWLFAAPQGMASGTLASSQLKRGKEVFRSAGCWYCHHPTLTGLRWGALSSRFANERGWVAYFYNPRALRPQSSKSAFRWLLRQKENGRYELNAKGKALVAYLRRAQRTSFAPQRQTRRWVAMPASAQARPGLPLYQRLCASCHGARGFGDGRLADILPVAPRDLTKPRSWLCRTHNSASVTDIRRTLKRQTGGCGMVALRDSLSEEQREALTDMVRRIAGLNRVVVAHPALGWKPPSTPRRFLLRKRAFRDWVKAVWERSYDRWLDTWRKERGRFAHIPFRHWRDWKSWVEWQSFGLWVRANARNLRISEGDWQRAMQQNKRLREVFQAWLQSGRKRPWIAFVKRTLRQKLRVELKHRFRSYKKSNRRTWPWYNFWGPYLYRRNWMKYEMRREWPRMLRRYDYQSYPGWRERRERDLFRRWLRSQSAQMYWAWKGATVYRKMGCVSCHGASGKGRLIQVLSRSVPKTKKAGLVAYRVADLRTGSFRCGTSWEDVFRSIVVGVGEHMRGLTERQLRTYLQGAPLPPNLWQRMQHPQANVLREDLWSLAAYVRFLGQQIPLLRGMTRTLP